MSKPYTISIIVSGEQGQVMRSDHVMPLAMIDVLKEAIDKAKHYEEIAKALAVGPIRLDAVCDATGLSRLHARQLLKIAGAFVVFQSGGKPRVDVWALESLEEIQPQESNKQWIRSLKKPNKRQPAKEKISHD
jgi:hypothetical protein